MPIRYGIIGTNWITTSWIHAASKTGQWELHSVYSRTQEQAEKFGAQHGQTKNLYTSLEAFAADPQLAVAYVASPNSLHYVQTKQLLEAGKHVILEKPATDTTKQLTELFALARAKGLFLIEAFRHIQEANYRMLRRMLIDEKVLGPIYGATLQFASYSSRYAAVLAGETPNVFSPNFGGGALVDVGVYPVAFAVALFGRPESQTYAPFICSTGVDAGGVALLRYPTFGVQINVSKAYTSTQPCEIYGEKGTMTLNQSYDISSVSIWSPSTKETKEFAGPKKAYEKPDVNMEEEAVEFARILEEKDTKAALALEQISLDILAVTMDLRRQNGILFPADREEGA